MDTSNDDTSTSIEDFLTDENEFSSHEFEDYFDFVVCKELSFGEVVVGDFVLVKLASKKQCLHYVGQIEQKRNDVEECDVKFLKKKGSQFFFPECEDQWPLPITDIVAKLPKPITSGGTARAKRLLSFSIDFTNIKMG